MYYNASDFFKWNITRYFLHFLTNKMCFLELLWYFIWLLITTPSSFLILLLVYMFHYLAIVFFLSSNCIRSFLFFYQIDFSVKETNIDQQFTCCFILLKFNSSDVQFINTVINTCRTNILKKCDLKIWQKRLFRKK